MWRLLKSEIVYNKDWLSVINAVFLLFLAGALVCSYQGYRVIRLFHVPLLIFVSGYASMTLLLFRAGVEKRTRLLAQLPVDPGSIAVVRVLFPLAVYTVQMLVFLVVTFFSRSVDVDIKTKWTIVYQTGVFLVLNSIWFVLTDITYIIGEKRRAFNIPIAPVIKFFLMLAAMIGFCFFFSIQATDTLFVPVEMHDRLGMLFAETSGLLLINTAGIVLTIVSITLFVRRRSFLE